jgi:hypothetical protein
MVIVKWTRIEIGYESDEIENCAVAPPMHRILCTYFDAASRLRWTQPGITDLGDVVYLGDNWVSLVIEAELNRALIGGGRIQASILCRLRHGSLVEVQRAFPSGHPGTRCKLVGDRWVNSRSYLLLDEHDAPWPGNKVPSDAMVFATVDWNCWPEDGHVPLP